MKIMFTVCMVWVVVLLGLQLTSLTAFRRSEVVVSQYPRGPVHFHSNQYVTNHDTMRIHAVKAKRSNKYILSYNKEVVDNFWMQVNDGKWSVVANVNEVLIKENLKFFVHLHELCKTKISKEEGFNVEEFITNLKTVASQMNPSLQRALFMPGIIAPLVEQALPFVRPEKNDFSDIIWSLGRLQFNCNANRDLVTKLMKSFFDDPHDAMTPESFARGVMGMIKLQIKRDVIDDHSMEKIFDYIVSLGADFNARETSNLIYSLASMDISTYEFSSAVNNTLISMVAVHLDEMVDQGVCNTIYGLGVLGFEWNYMPAPLQQNIFDRLFVTMPNMTSQGISNTIYGLGLMKASCSAFPLSFQTLILKMIEEKFPQMIDIGVSALFHGLSSIGFSWTDFSKDVVEVIDRKLLSLFVKSSPWTVSGFLYSAGKMGLNMKSLTKETQQLIQKAFEDTIGHMSTAETANALYGLGLAGRNWKEFSLSFRGVIETRLQNDVMKMSAQELTILTYGLGRLDFDWTKVKYKTFTIAIDAIMKHISNMNSQELPVIIYGLGLSKCKWHAFSHQTQVQIQQAILRKLPHLTEQGLSITLFGLSCMDIKLVDLVPELQQGVLVYLRDNLPKMSSYGVVNNVYSIALMGVGWQNLQLAQQERIQSAIVGIIERMDEQGVARTICSLSIMGVSWDNLERDTKVAMLSSLNQSIPSMIEQEIADTMYGLAVLSLDSDYSIPYDSLNPAVISEYPELESMLLLWYLHSKLIARFPTLNLDKMEIQARNKVAVYFQFLQLHVQSQRLVQELLTDFPQIEDFKLEVQSFQSSRSHIFISEAIQATLNKFKANTFEVLNEFDAFHGIYPMDIAVFCGNKPFAFVEIDGNFHYQIPSKLDELRRKDRLKELIYMNKYPEVKFFRIPMRQREKDVAQLGEKVASRILYHYQKKNNPSLRKKSTFQKNTFPYY